MNKFKCEKSGDRLDVFLTAMLDNVSRSKIKKMVKSGVVLVNGNLPKVGLVLNEGDDIYIKDGFDEKKVLKSEDLDVPIVYEDEDFFVLNKPAGMVVHPSEDGQNFEGTVANFVLDKVDKDAFEVLRPGIVHRLDKDTSGAMMIAKTKEMYNYFVKQFKDRSVDKYYIALVSGVLEHDEGVVNSPIGRDFKDRKRMTTVADGSGKEAISIYKVLEVFEIDEHRSVSLVEVQIKTGRTHQIRVHMAALGHGVVGDGVYGSQKLNKYFDSQFDLKRQFLHSGALVVAHPETGKKMDFVAKLPNDLEGVLDLLRE